MTSILTEISTVFEEARLKLAQKTNEQGVQRYADIVLIMDNLEKIQRIDGRNEGEESQRELFIERAPQLMGLGATSSTPSPSASCVPTGRNWSGSTARHRSSCP
jgi:hypothetical protein